jgi:hypothetical protein
MNRECVLSGAALMLLAAVAASAKAPIEKIRNDKVQVVEETLSPGEQLSFSADHAGVLAYLDSGSVELAFPNRKPQRKAVQRGETAFRAAEAGTLTNEGSATLRIVRTEFLGGPGGATWGTAGLGPDYKLLFENPYCRAYDIEIAAGASEPLHSHKDRVVVSLSGVELAHEMPDGRQQRSTLKTGEIVWRQGGTHVGHNIGKTDLRAIAIEPK